MLCDSRSSRWVIARGGSGACSRIVEPALALDAEEARLLGGDAGGERPRRVDVAYGDVALLAERVIREAVLSQVPVDVVVGPRDDRQDLDPPVLDADDRQALARARLGAPQPCKPRAGAQFVERPAHRLDLHDLVEGVDARFALLPEPAVPGLDPGGRLDRPVHPEVDPQARGEK